MTSKIQKTSKNLGYSKDKVTGLQCLRSSVKWHRLEHIATSLWDVYSGLFGDQAMILAVNSSFVDPSLQFESQLKIIESSFKKVFSIPSLEKVRQMGNSEDDKEDIENLYQNILNMYEDTLLILVSKDLYKLQILKDMAMWMNEDSSYLQERAIVVISRVLSFASRKVRGYASVDAPCLGVLAAELSLLCCHNDVSITQQASLGMHHLLCIAKCQNEDIEKTKSTKYEKHGNHCLLSPSSVQEFVPKVLQRDRAKIAQSVGQTLMPSLLTDFVWSLLMTLSSPNCVTAFKASTILKLTLEYHAHKVTMVSKIVDAIYKKLRENSSHAMRQAMLRVTTLLTRTSPKKVIFQLMDYPVPADDTLILMWHAAGSESSVAPHVLKTILLILKGKPGEVHASLPERRRFSLDTTNMMPVAASQALCTLLPVGSYKKAVAQFFPQLLMALMLQVFYISELRLVTEDRPFYARDALRVLLNCSGLQQVDIALKKKNCWNQFSEELFHHQGVYLIAKTLSEYNFPQFPETLQYLYKLSVEGPRRSEDTVITVIFFTELLNNFFKDPFPEEFLVLFRNWVNDSNPAVSKLSLQKIANMAPVINESNEGIRSMAIRHFGELLRDMSHYTWMLNDVVLGGLVPLILFLEDTDISVVKACRHTLTICTSELNWSTSSLLKDKYYNFELVVLNICNNLLVSHENYITDLISDTLGFLRSSRIYLRKASVILIGYLAKSGGHLLLRDEIEVMLEAIDRVLWDEDPIIRQLAEITHKIFKEIAHRLTSSHVKQTFRRLFHFIYIKKLKPLYNYNWPNNLASSPMKIKETDGDKEGLTDENYVYMFVKNET
ncbi:maestro heat-like repeat-containing protein family member 9 isoform X3 [Felis catus]|uniref:maestro heat-like repeat-containing protein family member 9 isoform X3 n=1 Tax=Felis catus TaxID=9685 RepID=UPI001D19D04A|nr:maestro heat-like repeat-containing protein family member 9 isoform X3 [Felis catus]